MKIHASQLSFAFKTREGSSFPIEKLHALEFKLFCNILIQVVVDISVFLSMLHTF